MAVDARQMMNLLPPQLITSNRNEFVNMYGTQMGSGGVPYAGTLPEAFMPMYQSLVTDNIQAKTSVDSGLTTYNFPATKKRSRDSILFPPQQQQQQQQKSHVTQFLPFLGEDVSYQIQQQQLEIDQMVQQHSKKMRMEIEERQKQHLRQLVRAIGEGMGKKLKEKDEQIQTMGKLNWVLQERVKSLYMENQVWRDLAHSNEATANSLRSNLEQVLAHVTNEERFSSGLEGGDDAESCCGSSDTGAAAEAEAEAAEEVRILAAEEGVKDKEEEVGTMGCRKCGEREACVLLMPCRHLCICAVCGSTLHSCPICNSKIDVTLHVNLS